MILRSQLSGWAAKATSEVSGLGFDERMRFAKTQVDWQALLPVTSHVSLSLSAAAGEGGEEGVWGDLVEVVAVKERM